MGILPRRIVDLPIFCVKFQPHSFNSVFWSQKSPEPRNRLQKKLLLSWERADKFLPETVSKILPFIGSIHLSSRNFRKMQLDKISVFTEQKEGELSNSECLHVDVLSELTEIHRDPNIFIQFAFMRIGCTLRVPMTLQPYINWHTLARQTQISKA